MAVADTSWPSFKLAPDPPVPPARVLGGQPHEQPEDLGREGRAPRAAAPAAGGPLPSYQLAVPAQQRLRADWEAPPLGAGQQAAEPGQDEPVTGAVAHAPGSAAKEPDFMAQDEELDVADEVRPRANQDQVEQQTDERVRDGDQHGRGSSPLPLSDCHRTRPTQ